MAFFGQFWHFPGVKIWYFGRKGVKKIEKPVTTAKSFGEKSTLCYCAQCDTLIGEFCFWCDLPKRDCPKQLQNGIGKKMEEHFNFHIS
jgi:hypothetical protein